MFSGVQVTLFRRMAGVAADWLACLMIVKGFHLTGNFTPLILFFAEVSVLTAFGGASFGHRIVRIKVVRFVKSRNEGMLPVNRFAKISK